MHATTQNVVNSLAQIVRLAQVGDLDRATTVESVWVCVACQTCFERCPKGVDVTGVTDAVRRVSAERDNAPAGVRRTPAFQQAFLATIRRYGRLNDLELIARWKARSFIEDASLPLHVRTTPAGTPRRASSRRCCLGKVRPLQHRVGLRLQGRTRLLP